MKRRCRALLVAGLWSGLLGSVEAQTSQTPRPGSLRITVRDATDLPIVAAQVIVTTAGGVPVQTVTNGRGVADLEALTPGRYEVKVESPGFEAALLADLTIRSGARTTRDVTLEIAGLVEELDVLPVDEERRLAQAFTTDLTADEIAALPEDPDELAAMLAQLAGTDAEIRVDGFLGELPMGTQIQSVRIRYDAASAGSSGGGPRIEIRTQPGGDRWRSTASLRIRDEALNARNAYAATRPSGQTRQYSWSLNGPLVKNRTGLSFSADRAESIEQVAIRAATPSGLFLDLIRQPTERFSVSSRIEHELTPAQRLRIEVQHSADHAINQGLSEFDLPERAFNREGQTDEVRFSHSATLPGQIVHDVRFQGLWRTTASQSESAAASIRVPGAFSMGGAQVQGGRRTREFEFEDEIVFPIGTRHQIMAGVDINAGHHRVDEWRNAGGTFTFASLDDLAAGHPDTFTQRTGDPRFEYSLYRFGVFLQEDFRVRRNLVLNLGIRNEFQTHLSDWANFTPRLGASWTPSSHLRTTLRGSLTTTYVPFQGSTYEQTVLVNGERQRELVIAAPSYPDPFLDGVPAAARAPGIIRTGPGLVMPATHRVSLAMDQPLAKVGRLRATYSRTVGRNLFRSLDANAPVNGVRPDPATRNITELESSGRSLNQSLELNLSLNYQPRRLSTNATYTFGQQHNETDGSLTLPPDSFHVDDEWGPSRQDIRHRFDASVNSDVGHGVRVSANVHAQSAAPYTITTGVDTNGDGVNNERPLGVGRNRARGAGTKNLDLTVTWGFGVGERALPPPRGRTTTATGTSASQKPPLVRFELYVQASNVLNLVNPQSFSGVQTSPFFGLPTSAAAPRRISLGSRVFF